MVRSIMLYCSARVFKKSGECVLVRQDRAILGGQEIEIGPKEILMFQGYPRTAYPVCVREETDYVYILEEDIAASLLPVQ